MGLVGAVLVTRADKATADGRPNDTDIEFVTMFHVSCGPPACLPALSWDVQWQVLRGRSTSLLFLQVFFDVL